MSAMRPFGARTRTILLLALAGLPVACQPMPSTTDAVGELRVLGPNVTLNGAPASDRMRIRGGDFIATGSNSRALVRFRPGGFVQLGENTDPNFLLQWLSSGLCLVKFILGNGTVGGDTDPCDHKITDSNGNEILAGSRYILKVEGETSFLMVLGGSARVNGARVVTVNQGEMVRMTRDTIEGPQRLSDQDIQRMQDWLNRFDSAPPNGFETPTIPDIFIPPRRHDRGPQDKLRIPSAPRRTR